MRRLPLYYEHCTPIYSFPPSLYPYSLPPLYPQFLPLSLTLSVSFSTISLSPLSLSLSRLTPPPQKKKKKKKKKNTHTLTPPPTHTHNRAYCSQTSNLCRLVPYTCWGNSRKLRAKRRFLIEYIQSHRLTDIKNTGSILLIYRFEQCFWYFFYGRYS